MAKYIQLKSSIINSLVKLLGVLKYISIGYVIGIFILIISSSDLRASEIDCKDFNSLERYQVVNLLKSIERGSEDNLGLTLAAIALQESMAGKYRINLKSKDFGLYQINAKTIEGIEKPLNDLQLSIFIQDTIFNDRIGVRYALNVLNYFKKYHNGNWRKMVQSYNAGHNYRNGYNYMIKISHNVKLIKRCML